MPRRTAFLLARRGLYRYGPDLFAAAILKVRAVALRASTRGACPAPLDKGSQDLNLPAGSRTAHYWLIEGPCLPTSPCCMALGRRQLGGYLPETVSRIGQESGILPQD